MAPFQRTPINCWSEVAAGLRGGPSVFTSLKSFVYVWLVSAGGGPGRNWLAEDKAKGVTFGQWVNTAAGKFGGVNWYTPGALTGVYGGGVTPDPSPVRIWMI